MDLLKYICTAVIIAISGTLLSSCGDKGGDESQPTVRTVLVYMVANNSLGQEDYYDEEDQRPYDERDLSEMVEGAAKGMLGSSRWIVYRHAYRQQPVLLEVTASGVKTLKTYDDTIPSVAVARMTEVIADTKTTAPADDYGLILWSHANGWLMDGIAEAGVRTRSFGDDNGKRMNITSLRRAIKDEGFSFIYADCCNMGTIEVAYELRDVTPWFAGSAAEMPGNGMPYDLTMHYFTGVNPDIAGAARDTYEHYRDEDKYWFTIGVVKTSELDRLAEETRRVYRESTYPAGYRPKYLDLNYRYYFDFKHFVDALTESEAGNDEDWNNAFDAAVVYRASMDRFLYLNTADHCGLATFIANNSADLATKGYSELQWYEDVARYQPLR